MDTPADIAAYVGHTALLLDLTLDDAQVQRVALHLSRTRALASALRDVPLGAEDELAQIFEPAPFPSEDPA
ncbi:AtzG-like protein [Piscinibacter sp.]|uniref:AtzG-like protein n=1 Tax=Piscinibacter sp. TaxID=1903157 RepID=UPI002BE29FFB|nr:AtzG-like protein [Albitalea sp.]HUG22634.1 AtzG-like protein [Albitalea sp.]